MQVTLTFIQAYFRAIHEKGPDNRGHKVKITGPDHIGSESSPEAFEAVLVPNLRLSADRSNHWGTDLAGHLTWHPCFISKAFASLMVTLPELLCICVFSTSTQTSKCHAFGASVGLKRAIAMAAEMPAAKSRLRRVTQPTSKAVTGNSCSALRCPSSPSPATEIKALTPLPKGLSALSKVFALPYGLVEDKGEGVIAYLPPIELLHKEHLADQRGHDAFP